MFFQYRLYLVLLKNNTRCMALFFYDQISSASSFPKYKTRVFVKRPTIKRRKRITDTLISIDFLPFYFPALSKQK